MAHLLEKTRKITSILKRSEEQLQEELPYNAITRQLASEFSPEELAMYILSLTVQDPDSLPEVEIAREKPLPFKPSGNGFGGKAKGGRRGDDRRDNRRGDNRRGRRDDFKKGSRGNDRDKEKRYRKDNKKPRNTSSEKQTGFVIRNKGDK